MRLRPTPARTGLLAVALGVACLVAVPARTQPPHPYDVEVVQTNAGLSQRLTRLPGLSFGPASPDRSRAVPRIEVDARVRYQAIGGFGAAMTDSSAWLIEREAAPAERATLMDELFGPGGIHLGFVRIPVGASDFTRDGRPYSYDDVPPGASDPRLRRFSIAHDRAYILPALRQVRALAPQAQFLASPWSAPAWMKANGSLSNRHGLGTLRPAAYGPWARYIARFVRDYARAGIPIGALTPQNEPGSPTAYPGLSLPAATESDWVARDLVPALAAAGVHPALYGGDLGWGPRTASYLSGVLLGPAGRALTGVAWHCYFGTPGVMSWLHRIHPRLRQIVDECSPGGPSPTPTPEVVISSLREWASTVALWNLALDPHGGPVQPPNGGCPGCVGLATVDERSGAVSLARSYFELGQASAFVVPGARRIDSPHFVQYRYPRVRGSVATPGLDDVALQNPDGSIVLIAYDGAPAPVRFSVAWRSRQFSYVLPAGATATFVWNRP